MSDSPLRMGKAVSISHAGGSQEEAVGVIVKNTPKGIGLSFFGLTSPLSLNQDDSVRVKFWNAGEICFWEGEVLETFGPEDRSVLVSRPQAVKVERRRFQRYSLEIPLTFTVIYQGERRVVARKVFNAKTKTLSAGAAEFETGVSLELDDLLDLKLYLVPSQQISTIGAVTRSLKETPVNSVVLQFLGLKPEDQDRIQEFLSQMGSSS